jgi:hypothetical protein
MVTALRSRQEPMPCRHEYCDVRASYQFTLNPETLSIKGKERRSSALLLSVIRRQLAGDVELHSG